MIAIAAAVAALALAAPPVAAVDVAPPPRPDKTGLVFVEGSTSAALQLNWSGADGSHRQYAFLLRPAAGVYVSNWVYLRLGFNFNWDRDGERTTFSAGGVPSVGVFLPLTSRLGFAPWVGLNVAYGHESDAGGSHNATTLAAETSLSLVLALVDHFSLSVGPDLQQIFTTTDSVASDGRAGKLALTFGVIGSW